MAHEHTHNHAHHHPKLTGKNLLISIVLNIVITLAQLIGGVVSGSLSLLSDAVHNLSDVITLIISYIAHVLAKKEASLGKTFGYKRIEILVAFINASTLIIVAILLIIEAIKRFNHPEPVASFLVIWLSLLGILANGFSVLLLKKDAKANMNMRSAYLHLFTDMLASIAVLIGGVFMSVYQVYWIDSLLSFCIALYLIWVGFDLLKTSFKVLMLFTPDSILIQDIVSDLKEIEYVKNVHHVHVWQLNENEVHFEAHMDFDTNISLTGFNVVLNQAKTILKAKYHINHVTIQPEYGIQGNKAIIIQD